MKLKQMLDVLNVRHVAIDVIEAGGRTYRRGFDTLVSYDFEELEKLRDWEVRRVSVAISDEGEPMLIIAIE